MVEQGIVGNKLRRDSCDGVLAGPEATKTGILAAVASVFSIEAGVMPVAGTLACRK